MEVIYELWVLGQNLRTVNHSSGSNTEVLLYLRLADLLLNSARWLKLWPKKSYFSMDLLFQLSYSIKNSNRGA